MRGFRGLQIRGQVTLVDHSQARPKHLCPESASLQGRINAKPRQIPMRIGWMSLLHLAQHREHDVMLIGGNGVGQGSDERVSVGLGTRWQP